MHEAARETVRDVLRRHVRDEPLLTRHQIPGMLGIAAVLTVPGTFVWMMLRASLQGAPSAVRQQLPMWLAVGPEPGEGDVAAVVAGFALGLVVAYVYTKRFRIRRRQDRLQDVEGLGDLRLAEWVYKELHPRDMPKHAWEAVEDELRRSRWSGDR